MELKNKRFLVVGGAGFIGSHIVDQLLRSEIKEVIIYDNFSRGTHKNLEKAIKDPRCTIFPHGGDILHKDLLDEAMKGIDGVFHLAALWLLHCYQYPEAAFEVNVNGTMNVIQAAIKNNVKKLVFSSSASVYGEPKEFPITEDHPYLNNTFYGATKIAGEHFLKSLGHRYDLDWVVLRYMNVYGERQDYSGAYTAVMHKVLDKIEAGESPVIFGDGSQQYDFINVKDIAIANLLAMQATASKDFYNVGRGVGTTIKELTELLLKLKDSTLPISYKDEGLTFVTKRVGSIDKAKKDLNFSWEVPLEDGMKSLIKWRKK
jgi:UDP-glucose 4-epimerase